ncbi:MAG: HlyD family secretion protein [Hyphomicrobiaceae bacterium]
MNIQNKEAEFENAVSPLSLRKVGSRLRNLNWTVAKLRRVLMVGGVLIVAVATGYAWLSGGRYISTDNAYIQAPKLLVSTDVSGLVADVRVHDGQAVKTGDILFTVDDKPFRIAVDNAKAQLDQAALNIQSMKEDYQRLLSDAAAQQSQVELAKATYDRTAALVKTGATTAANFDRARFTLNSARSQYKSLQDQAKVLLSKLGGDPDVKVTQHPAYLQAKAALEEMQRQLDHTVVRAPFDGIVTQVDHLQPGTYLVASTASLTNTGAVALIGTDELWIDANFKETDLTYAHEGDPAEITVDAYPGRTWKGRIASISPASGAEFSILPAQNASGNWVKVVQRIPVRIAIEQQPDAPKLRAGMSTYVTVDTGHKRSISELW